MNAMKEAMVSAVSKNTKFPKFLGSVMPVVVQPRPHIIIPVRSDGNGIVIKGKKITREVAGVVKSVDGGFLLRDSCGEVWEAEQITDYVYQARS
ncbi:MAG: hypothetical protein H6961_06995 [Chromatiaceae bacterium]|nr:hypothetical protein [Chromatiaceae bacterium]